MKVCILLYHLDLGGVEKTAVDLENELAAAGHEVDIRTIYKFKPKMFDIDSRVKVHKFIGKYFKGLNNLVSLLPSSVLYRLIVGNRDYYDIEIAFQAELPTKIISDSLNFESKKFAWVHGLGLKYSNVYENFEKIFFVSKELLEYNKNNNFPSELHNKLDIFYNPIDFEEIRTKAGETFTYKGDPNTIRFISVGRLSGEKRFDRLIDSFRIVNSKYKNTSLEIVGSGRLDEELKNKVEDLKLDGNITFHGYSQNPYKYIKNADVYVCSSDNEGFNVAMSEAAILGVPVISTDVFGASELLGSNAEYGIIVKKTDTDLADAMTKMLDENLRMKYSNEISKRVYSIFKIERETQVNNFIGTFTK